MTYRQIVLSALCALAFGGLFNQAHGAQAAATATKAVARQTYPLFTNQSFSSLANFLVRSKSTLQTTSSLVLAGGLLFLALGVAFYQVELQTQKNRTVTDKINPDSAANILGSIGLIKTIVGATGYLLLELTTPLIGLSTMIAGE